MIYLLEIIIQIHILQIQNRFKTLVDSESEEECGKQLSPLRDDKHKKQKEHHESKMKKVNIWKNH